MEKTVDSNKGILTPSLLLEAWQGHRRLTRRVIEAFPEKDFFEFIPHLGLKDIFYNNKVVGVGDAISAINPRGGEGIRYAMQSGDLAATYIEKYLKTGKENFNNYRKEWLKSKRKKWKLSEYSAARMYSRYTDNQIENRIRFFHKTFSIDEMIDSLFNFKYNKVLLRFFQYSFLKFSYLFKKEKF